MSQVLVSDTERDFETGEALYWSNIMGWVDKASATVFADEDFGLYDVLIADSHWERLETE